MEKETSTQTSFQVPSSHTGWNLDVWRFMPTGKHPPLPVIIMAHELAANKSMGLRTYAEAFAKAGYACLVFDYRRWGASGGAPRHVLIVNEQLDDYKTMIKYAKHQPEFDPQRIILWGTGLSGGHVLTLAGDSSLGVFAAITQGPYTGVTPLRERRLSFNYLYTMAWSFYDAIKQFVGLDPSYISAWGPPGTMAALSTQDSKEGMSYLLADKSSHNPNEISASSMFEVFRYYPLNSAPKIECPLLAIQPEEDKLCALEGAEKVVQNSKNGELVKIPGAGHYEVYPNGPHASDSISAQLSFLGRVAP